MVCKLLLPTFLLGAAVALFIISFFVDYKCTKPKVAIIWSLMTIAEKLAIVKAAIRALLYMFILGVSSIYVICNFSDCVNFTFFNEFNGKNLIFVLCLALWILPIFSKFKIFGFVFEIWSGNTISQMANVASDPRDILTPEMLDELNETIKKE